MNMLVPVYHLNKNTGNHIDLSGIGSKGQLFTALDKCLQLEDEFDKPGRIYFVGENYSPKDFVDRNSQSQSQIPNFRERSMPTKIEYLLDPEEDIDEIDDMFIRIFISQFEPSTFEEDVIEMNVCPSTRECDIYTHVSEYYKKMGNVKEFHVLRCEVFSTTTIKPDSKTEIFSNYGSTLFISRFGT